MTNFMSGPETSTCNSIVYHQEEPARISLQTTSQQSRVTPLVKQSTLDKFTTGFRSQKKEMDYWVREDQVRSFTFTFTSRACSPSPGVSQTSSALVIKP